MVVCRRAVNWRGASSWIKHCYTYREYTNCGLGAYDGRHNGRACSMCSAIFEKLVVFVMIIGRRHSEQHQVERFPSSPFIVQQFRIASCRWMSMSPLCREMEVCRWRWGECRIQLHFMSRLFTCTRHINITTDDFTNAIKIHLLIERVFCLLR